MEVANVPNKNDKKVVTYYLSAYNSRDKNIFSFPLPTINSYFNSDCGHNFFLSRDE